MSFMAKRLSSACAAVASEAAQKLEEVATKASDVTSSGISTGSDAVGSGLSKASATVGKVLEKPLAAVTDKIKAEYGAESLEMLSALAEITHKTCLKELSLHKMQYSVTLALPLISIADSAQPSPVCGDELNLTDGIGAQARRYVDFAAGAYGTKHPPTDKEKVSTRLGLSGEAVLMAYLPKAGVQCPGHYVAIDAENSAVVLGIRGTVNLSDAITDAVGNSVPLPGFPDVQTHQAILASAQEVLKQTREFLSQALTDHPTFDLVVCGHSLGAGTSILCTLLLHAEPLASAPKLRCFAYAPPPLIGPAGAPGLEAVEIYSFVNRNDVVPRTSLHNCYMLGLTAKAVDACELSLAERLALISGRGKPEGHERSKEIITAATVEAREKAKAEDHDEFVQHFIPGKVFWMGAPDESGTQSVRTTTAAELQGLLMKGGASALTDHKITAYQKALASSAKPSPDNADPE
eukprot:TRINITY_DN28245_c0_g1_i1.p1 TRINITY_DN28245_c0_g1~~TRINITY_DN28245_c0_g1_i1.p1  ORF type:complete len:464 (+),score=98.34 TRINITY_DN28245_c0_g1_i1:27-1418(+)